MIKKCVKKGKVFTEYKICVIISVYNVENEVENHDIFRGN